MKPELVKPAKWMWDQNKQPIILYSEDQYSIIWGRYEGKIALGARYDGEDNANGYPKQGGNPLWYVEPDFLRLPILFELLRLAVIDKSPYIENIRKAIEECTNAFLQEA